MLTMARMALTISVGVVMGAVAACSGSGSEPGIEEMRAALRNNTGFLQDLQKVLDAEYYAGGLGGEASEEIASLPLEKQGKCKPAGDSFDCTFRYVREGECLTDEGTDADQQANCETTYMNWTVGHFRQGSAGWQVELPK